MKCRSLLFLLSVSVAANFCRADEWPKWRGPNGDGISHETGLLDKWPDSGPKKLWEVPVGLGFSSPIGNDGKIYLLSQDGDNTQLQCFDADSGKVLWTKSTPGGYPKNDFPGARATPTIDGKLIYTLGGGGNLSCRDSNSGELVWAKQILQQTHAELLTWGQASSPLVTEKYVYVQSGDGGPIAVAVDKQSGAIVWSSQAQGKAGYAAPVLANVNGTPILIVFGGDALYGMNPDTGSTLWSQPWPTKYGVNASTPIVVGDKLFISSAYEQGAGQFQLLPNGIKRIWFSDEVRVKFPAPVYDNGYLYCVSEDHNGTIRCLDWQTGKLAWAGTTGGRAMKLGFGGSFVRDGDKLYTMSQSGLLSLMSATPKEIAIISQFQLFDEGFSKVWSTPLIYHGKLYAKGLNTLACLDISQKGNP